MLGKAPASDGVQRDVAIAREAGLRRACPGRTFLPRCWYRLAARGLEDGATSRDRAGDVLQIPNAPCQAIYAGYHEDIPPC
jgi:hypothetical protein